MTIGLSAYQRLPHSFKVPRGTSILSGPNQILAILFVSTQTAAAESTVQSIAAAELHRQLIIESAGLFWIAAELVILFYTIAITEYLENKINPPNWSLSPQAKRRARRWVFVFSLIALLVFVRRVLIPTPTNILQQIGTTPEDLAATVTTDTLIHLSLWSAFITIWIILEVFIVYYGVRAFRSLHRTIEHDCPLT